MCAYCIGSRFTTTYEVGNFLESFGPIKARLANLGSILASFASASCGENALGALRLPGNRGSVLQERGGWSGQLNQVRLQGQNHFAPTNGLLHPEHQTGLAALESTKGKAADLQCPKGQVY